MYFQQLVFSFQIGVFSVGCKPFMQEQGTYRPGNFSIIQRPEYFSRSLFMYLSKYDLTLAVHFDARSSYVIQLGLGISIKSERRSKKSSLILLVKMELDDICRLFHRYNFDNDTEFQSGLEKIFKTSSLETPERFMQAKILYFSK